MDVYGASGTRPFSLCFFFNDTATTEIYTLSLHDALPISCNASRTLKPPFGAIAVCTAEPWKLAVHGDRKSTRLNSSHTVISYAVFCLKKKKNKKHATASHGSPTTHSRRREPPDVCVAR